MAKMRMSKAAQIKGLRKALANKKTPRQFLPSLRKRLAKLGAAAIAIMALWAWPTYGQTLVTVQPTQQTLAPAGTACTGSAQTFTPQNRNQTQHWATVVPVGAQSFQMEIDGIDSSGNTFRISDVAAVNGTITASGYFPKVQVKITCSPNTATFTLGYSGSSSTYNVNAGTYLSSQIDKFLFSGVAGNADQVITLQPPFGSSSGTLIFQYVTSSVASSALLVSCNGNVTIGAFKQFRYTIANDTNAQEFSVPASVCPQMTVNYAHGGAATAFNLEYVFDPPGALQGANQLNPCLVGPVGTGGVVAISVGANTTQRVVAPLADKLVTVCTLFATAGVAGTATISEGTGATCGTNNVALSGAMALAVGTPLGEAAAPALFQTIVAGDGLCITTAGGATLAGLLTFNYTP